MLSSESNEAADEKLVEAIRKNEQDAFKILYYRYFPKLIRFAFYRSHSVETVRDLSRPEIIFQSLGRKRNLKLSKIY